MDYQMPRLGTDKVLTDELPSTVIGFFYRRAKIG